MRHHRLALVLALVAPLAACDKPAPPPPEMPALGLALPSVPVPPRSRLVRKTGSADAVNLRFQSATAPDTLLIYYRELLGKPPWRMVSDAPAAEGARVLQVEYTANRPMWVRIWPNVEFGGSYVDITGAVPAGLADSLAAASDTAAAPALDAGDTARVRIEDARSRPSRAPDAPKLAE